MSRPKGLISHLGACQRGHHGEALSVPARARMVTPLVFAVVRRMNNSYGCLPVISTTPSTRTSPRDRGSREPLGGHEERNASGTGVRGPEQGPHLEPPGPRRVGIAHGPHRDEPVVDVGVVVAEGRRNDEIRDAIA